jgi:DNA polymerase I-like protein with 3'-5' exonuclease and polymerase domains
MIYERINNELIKISKQELIDLFDTIEFGEYIPIDTETTGLDPYLNTILLVSFKLKERIFVIDWTKTQFDFNYYDRKYNPIWVAHNAKFDAKMFQSHGQELEYWYCTMIVDQKIYQGLDFTKYGLNDLKLRYLKLFPTIDKEIRNTFIGRDPLTFKPSDEELLYAADDIDYLLDIMSIQVSSLTKSNPALLEFLLTDGLGAMRANVDIELEGFHFDSEHWLAIYNDNKKKLDSVLNEIEEWIGTNHPSIDIKSFDTTRSKNIDNCLKQIEKVSVRIETYEQKVTLLITEGKTEQKQYQKAIDMLESSQTKLADYKIKLEEVSKQGSINLNSNLQINKLFEATKVDPLPKKRDKATGKESVSADKNVLKEWLAENPGNPNIKLMDLISKYVKINHSMNNFGDKYLRFINPKTNCIHTYYWDEGSETGRYRSGDTKKNINPNFQQLPSKGNYRECFYKNGKHLCIVDWSGAELTIMISLAQDWTLKEIADSTRDENGDPDLHSYFATRVWREIYKHRLAEAMKNNAPESEIRELETLCNITITNVKSNPFYHLRGVFKGITFN